MDEQTQFRYRKGNPWLCYNEHEDREEYITGNRDGLMALRDAIDSALEAGDCPIEIPYSHFGGVARVDRDPEGESAAPTSSVSVIKMWLGALVVGVIIAFILGLGMGGAILLIRWLKEWLFG